MRQQKGFVFKASHGWYVKYRDNVLENGKIVRKLLTHRLADVDDFCRTKSDAEKKAKEFLAPLNDERLDARSTMTLKSFVEDQWLPSLESTVRPATRYGYKRTWHDYLEPVLGRKALRDIKRSLTVPHLRTLQIDKGPRVARGAKAVGSAIFAYANLLEIVEHNPFAGRLLPKHERTEQQAVSLNEVAAQLAALKSEPQARAAIALGFFGGLRPAEIRGLKWEDYDAKEGQFLIRRSMWRTKENGTKTPDAEGLVSVKGTLAQYLEDLRQHDGGPTSGFILRNENGGSMSLENLVRRTILPTLRKVNVPWYGFYSLRRGGGTSMTLAAGDRGLAAKGLLRHKTLQTTTQFYVKDVPEETNAAAQKVDQMFQKCSKELEHRTSTEAVRYLKQAA
jgi:integrase